jgi:hypothetical protein
MSAAMLASVPKVQTLGVNSLVLPPKTPPRIPPLKLCHSLQDKMQSHCAVLQGTLLSKGNSLASGSTANFHQRLVILNGIDLPGRPDWRFDRCQTKLLLHLKSAWSATAPEWQFDRVVRPNFFSAKVTSCKKLGQLGQPSRFLESTFSSVLI